MSRLRYLEDDICRMDEETVQILAEIEMKLDQALQEPERILGPEHADTVSLVNLLGEFSSAQRNWPKAEAMLKRESEVVSKICDEEDPMAALIDGILESIIATTKATAADEIEFDDGHYMLARENSLSVLRECDKEDPPTRYAFDCLNYFSENGIYDNTLWDASLVGNKKVVQMLLDQGADVNAQGKHGNALQVASLVGNEKVVQMLLDQGADVNIQGGEYGTALRAASSQGQGKLVQMLLDQGADINDQGGMYDNALHAALSERQEKVVQMLLDRGADVNAQGGLYGSVLRAASYQGHQKVVQMLLDRGADYESII